MKDVYLLYHILNEDTDDEVVKLLGVYTSYELAFQAQIRVSDHSAFIGFSDGFRIFDHWINHDDWVDGFIT
ncbi:hypothetical protein FNH48_23570 [Salmonella enterica subsp. salamae]|nr:hypothetical protein [Salmonella enterica subsp. salamae]